MRAAPFVCPYCAEEALEPASGDHLWYCDSCDRTFELRFKGIGRVAP